MSEFGQQKAALSRRETAKLLGLGLNSTAELINSGRLRSVRAGRRILIPRKEIEAFLERELGGQS